MAESRIPGTVNPPAGGVLIPARTACSLGINDQADPGLTTLLGDTPGSLGMNDRGDPTLARLKWAGLGLVTPIGTVDGQHVAVGRRPQLQEGKKADATIHYAGKLAKIHVKAENILKEICREAGLSFVTITSTTRTAADQARIMYDNIILHGVDAQHKLYAAAGDKVIDEYVALKQAGKQPHEIKAGMEKKISEIGPQKVSKHCADTTKICVLDVAPSSVPKKERKNFEAIVTKHKGVNKFLLPPGDPAYHMEIPII